jgi:hypothetical protein
MILGVVGLLVAVLAWLLPNPLEPAPSGDELKPAAAGTASVAGTATAPVTASPGSTSPGSRSGPAGGGSGGAPAGGDGGGGHGGPTSSAPSRSRAKPGQLLYRADWSAGLGQWTNSNYWTASGGSLVSDNTILDPSGQPTIVAPVDLTGIPDYSVTAKVRFTAPGDGMSAGISYGIAVRAAGVGSAGGYFGGICVVVSANICPQPTSTGGALLDAGDLTDTGGRFASVALTFPDAHTLTLSVRGDQVTLTVDGTVTLTRTDNRYPEPGVVGLWTMNATVAVDSFEVRAL